MLNQFDAFAHDIILKRAEIAHAEMCAYPDTCIRREVIAEMQDALNNLSRRG